MMMMMMMYCIVLYCIVLYCIVLYCIVLYCIILYCIVLYCIVLYHNYDNNNIIINIESDRIFGLLGFFWLKKTNKTKNLKKQLL